MKIEGTQHSHFKSPAEFLFWSLCCHKIVCHDELLWCEFLNTATEDNDDKNHADGNDENLVVAIEASGECGAADEGEEGEAAPG